ncbi:FHA domain-containing serine/threonine-protein kinase [Candidatus Uabimicrobium sp. HlEnr_7]|uniref:FHA domain-containing serine/threonine-protein kinase n=1 Tax=Candidatus Uabimicrobium helgolandensis TaxID=3095367 RepID=UPI003556926F
MTNHDFDNNKKDSFSSRIKASLSSSRNDKDQVEYETLERLRHISVSEGTDSTVAHTPLNSDTNIKANSKTRNDIQLEVIKLLDTERYEIVEEIGSGGFGRVYKGFDSKLSREIAIKTIRFDKEIAKKVEFFEQEARTLAQCNHPNIVQIHDVQKNNDSPYIVMEFVNGPNICEYIKILRASKKSENVQRIICSHIIDLIDALSYMHKREIYHQDIKPKNILISLSNNCAKLVDFGLAIDYFDKRPDESFSGTYGYMPPEKFAGKGSPHMHDIYALGAVFFEILTGRVAHPGKNAKEIASHVVYNEVRFAEEDTVDNKLQKICLKCLAKNADERYQDFPELYKDLMSFLGNNTAVNDYPYLSLIVDNKKLVFPLTQSKNFIGRTFNNQIVIPDPSISRSQAVIEIDESVKIKNLSEINKIKVGNIELSSEQKIKLVGHETIQIADYIFHYIPRSEILDLKEIIVEIEGQNSQIVDRVVTPLSVSQKEAEKIGLTYSQINDSMWEQTISTQKKQQTSSFALSTTRKNEIVKSQDIKELQESIEQLKKSIEKIESKIIK